MCCFSLGVKQTAGSPSDGYLKSGIMSIIKHLLLRPQDRINSLRVRIRISSVVDVWIFSASIFVLHTSFLKSGKAMLNHQLLNGSGSFLRKYKFWSRGYVIKKGFLTQSECQKIRLYVMSLSWNTGATKLPHGSHCVNEDNLIFSFNECLLNEQVVKSHELLIKETGEEVIDVGLRSLQLRMHSPIWHIDMQTFNNDNTFVARDQRFKVYKCGVYLQGESNTGGGTLEIKQPFLGGGLKNLLFTGNINGKNHKILRGVILILGILSDCIQIRRKKLDIDQGDLIIFSGSLRHRASQKINNMDLQIDIETGYYTDVSDREGKIMLQWEFVKKNEFGKMYIDHALMKHSTASSKA